MKDFTPLNEQEQEAIRKAAEEKAAEEARIRAEEEARRIAEKYIAVADKNFTETGNLWEKYDTVTGGVSVTKEYKTPKMMGWSAGVYMFCLDFLGK